MLTVTLFESEACYGVKVKVKLDQVLKFLASACESQQKLSILRGRKIRQCQAKLPENFFNKLSPFKFAQHVTCSF